MIWRRTAAILVFSLIGAAGAPCPAQPGGPTRSGRPDGEVVLRRDRPGGGYPGSISRAAFSRDGSKVATTDRVARLCIWDAATGKLLVKPERFGPDLRELPAGINFTASGNYVAICGLFMRVEGVRSPYWSGGLVRLWNVPDPHEVARVVSETPITFVGFSGDSKRMITIDKDGVLKSFDLDGTHVMITPAASLRYGAEVRNAGDALNRTIGIDERGVRVVRTSQAGRSDGLLLFDLERGSVRFFWPGAVVPMTAMFSDVPTDQRPGVRQVAVAADGSRFAIRVVGQPDVVHLYDFETLAYVRSLGFGPDWHEGDGFDSLRFSRDGRLLAAGRDGRQRADGLTAGAVRVVEIASARRVATLEGVTGFIHDYCFTGTALRILTEVRRGDVSLAEERRWDNERPAAGDGPSGGDDPVPARPGDLVIREVELR